MRSTATPTGSGSRLSSQSQSVGRCLWSKKWLWEALCIPKCYHDHFIGLDCSLGAWEGGSIALASCQTGPTASEVFGRILWCWSGRSTVRVGPEIFLKTQANYFHLEFYSSGEVWLLARCYDVYLCHFESDFTRLFSFGWTSQVGMCFWATEIQH